MKMRRMLVVKGTRRLLQGGHLVGLYEAVVLCIMAPLWNFKFHISMLPSLLASVRVQ